MFEKAGVLILILLLALPAVASFLEFCAYFVAGKRLINKELFKLVEITAMICYPLFFFVVIDEKYNDCCTDSAVFSPDHKLTIYVIVAVCVLVYGYCAFRKNIAPPLIELFINSILMLSLVLNIFIAIHADQPLWLFGNLPVIMLVLLMLLKNHQLFLNYAKAVTFREDSRFQQMLWNFMQQDLLKKVPVLMLLFIPVLVIISVFLLLFSQEPDSVIRAFTDTYKHGLSQLDFECDNVNCGDHFLCSVAAGGHQSIVKPVRMGVRRGRPIVCNRQLLIANAFEELVETNFPGLHHRIRHQYNKVGDMIHRYYFVFNRKMVADLVYFLMKPLEWLFLIALYLTYKNPEAIITRQYMGNNTRI